MPRIGRTRRLVMLAAERGWNRLSESEWLAARQEIPKLSPEDVLASGLPADPPWSGIRQHTLDDLEVSLRAFTAVYEARPDLRPFIRQTAIRARDHARFALRSGKPQKVEMTDWMMVWLSDPSLFPHWIAIRRRLLDAPPKA